MKNSSVNSRWLGVNASNCFSRKSSEPVSTHNGLLQPVSLNFTILSRLFIEPVVSKVKVSGGEMGRC